MEKRSDINTKLRTPECWYDYQTREPSDECFLCDIETLECFMYWFICENQYPYDNVATTHHMLAPIRHVAHEKDLTKFEKRELELILNRLNDAGNYDCIMRNFTVGQSHKSHLHYHLLTWKRCNDHTGE